MAFETVIGLEVHAQLKTASKLFCGCSTEFGAAPNTHVCPVCMGLPGVLPVVNAKAVEYAVRMALATECRVPESSIFARKNYFYPDLPKGYQISQFEDPLAVGGRITVDTGQGPKEIGITRIHMEDDAGKLVHDEHQPKSYVDLNRTGTPLIEIVSEPDMRSSDEAVAYLKQIREILRYLDVCDGNMEQGSLRCDANVSIRPVGQEEFGTRAELKNMNSFKAVKAAIEYEVRRQEALIESGGQVVQETRLWNPDKNETLAMRGKEEAHDYRYFPDPDLVPVEISRAWLEEIRADLPELPEARRARFVAEYGLPEYDAEVLCSGRAIADYFEEAAKVSGNPKTASNWIMTELMAALKGEAELKVAATDLGNLIKLIDSGQISGKIGKKVLAEMIETGKSAEAVIDEQGLKQISDTGELDGMIDSILAANQDAVEKYRAGQKKLMGFFVGQVMKETKGQANPGVVNELLRKKLGS